MPSRSCRSVWKLGVGILIWYVIFIGFRFTNSVRHLGRNDDLQLRSLAWLLAWLLGIGVISGLGQYDGASIIPDWIDLLVVAAWSLIIF